MLGNINSAIKSQLHHDDLPTFAGNVASRCHNETVAREMEIIQSTVSQAADRAAQGRSDLEQGRAVANSFDIACRCLVNVSTDVSGFDLARELYMASLIVRQEATRGLLFHAAMDGTHREFQVSARRIASYVCEQITRRLKSETLSVAAQDAATHLQLIADDSKDHIPQA